MVGIVTWEKGHHSSSCRASHQSTAARSCPAFAACNFEAARSNWAPAFVVSSTEKKPFPLLKWGQPPTYSKRASKGKKRKTDDWKKIECFPYSLCFCPFCSLLLSPTCCRTSPHLFSLASLSSFSHSPCLSSLLVLLPFFPTLSPHFLPSH